MAAMGRVRSVLAGVGGTNVPPRCPVVREHVAEDHRPPRLLERVRAALLLRHYGHRTEEAYVCWIRRCILFHGRRHPSEMGEREMTAFLSNLATERRLSASTQNQALSALLFEIVAVRASYEADLEADPIGRGATRLFNRYRDRTSGVGNIAVLLTA